MEMRSRSNKHHLFEYKKNITKYQREPRTGKFCHSFHQHHLHLHQVRNTIVIIDFVHSKVCSY